jgi:hypothetical protein
MRRNYVLTLGRVVSNSATHRNDLAVLRLHARVNTTVYRPVALNTLPANEAAQSVATALGYGATVLGGPLLGALKQVSLSLWTLASCNSAPLGVAITGDSLCAGSNTVGVCTGDGGAPLVRVVSGVATLLGMFSFTVWPGKCAATGYPAVFSRVSTASASAFIASATRVPVNDDFRNALLLDCFPDVRAHVSVLHISAL